MPVREQENEERMDFRKSKKLIAILAACYWGLVLAVYLVAGVQFHYTAVTSDALSASATIGELVDGMTVEQIEKLLRGNTCGPRPTSCADQLAIAVQEAYKKEQAGE